MATIKIKDLPKDMKIGRDELKRIRGGAIAPMSIRYGKIRYAKYDEAYDKWYKLRPQGMNYLKW